MQLFQVSHVIFLTNNFTVFICGDTDNYLSHTVELSDEQYNEVRGFVENGGYGEYALVVNDVTYTLIHSVTHILKYASAVFAPMRSTRRLAKSASYVDIVEADYAHKVELQRVPMPPHLR